MRSHHTPLNRPAALATWALASLLSVVLPAGEAMAQDAAPGLVLPATAQAARGSEPATSRAGPYLIVGAGRSSTTQDEGFVTCRCRSGNSTLFKLGGGWRFGVSALEAWAIDFGATRLDADWLSPESTVRTRALAVGGAWTARFGSGFEATWRVAAAHVTMSDSAQGSASVWRPLVGASAGWRLTDATSLELALDITSAESGGGHTALVSGLGLSLRQRF